MNLDHYKNVPDGYRILKDILDEALDQASRGKGKARHAEGVEAFEDQQICEIPRRVGVGFNLGQAVKKCYESKRLAEKDVERGVAELLGAINYIAGAIIVMRDNERNVKSGS